MHKSTMAMHRPPVLSLCRMCMPRNTIGHLPGHFCTRLRCSPQSVSQSNQFYRPKVFDFVSCFCTVVWSHATAEDRFCCAKCRTTYTIGNLLPKKLERKEVFVSWMFSTDCVCFDSLLFSAFFCCCRNEKRNRTKNERRKRRQTKNENGNGKR